MKVILYKLILFFPQATQVMVYRKSHLLLNGKKTQHRLGGKNQILMANIY